MPEKPTLTGEQVAAFAPDTASVNAARSLANPRKWPSSGCDERAVWGECQGSGSKPYQVSVDLTGPAYRCSCPSYKVPCKHALGVLLLLSAQPDAIAVREPPAWVQEWLAKRDEKAGKAAAKQEKAANPVDPKAREKRIAAREAKVRAGLDELDLWLRDLVRGGLAGAASRPYAYWDGIAARMIDAQAGGLARQLRDLASLANSRAGWQDEMLRRLGRMHLLIQAYRRQDELSPDLRATVRSLVGWQQNQDELRGTGTPVRDHWLAMGFRAEQEEFLTVGRLWLWGRDSGRPALFLQFAQGDVEAPVPPGTGIDGDFVFYPGARSVRAVLEERLSAPQPLDEAALMVPVFSIAAANEDYAAALAENPWLEKWPYALEAVPLRQDDRAWLRDAAGDAWPLPPGFGNLWKLFAISGGATLKIFGEWDSRQFTPFGALSGTRWVGL